LVRASEIDEIADPCPLVTVAVHRVLLAILHRVFSPRNLGEWCALRDARTWPSAPLEAYLHRWRLRFDLFDDANPFYQVPDLAESLAGPSSRLLPQLASGNNPTLFDHTTDDAPPVLLPATAASYVIAAQAFSVGGTVARETDAERSADAAPLVKGAVVLLRGRTLFETLMLNLIPYDPTGDEPFAVHGTDAPAWERPPVDRPLVRWPSGYLDLLTWQSRRLRLIPEPTAEGGVGVRRVVIMKGAEFPEGFSLHGHETMLAFRKQLQAQSGESPWLPLGFATDRALWRDSLALVQSLDNRRARPRTLDWLSSLLDGGALGRASAIPLDLFGLCTSRAKILFWRQERVTLPPVYLAESGRYLLGALERALRLAEETATLLRRATERLARGLIESAGRRADRRQTAALVERFQVGRAFWSRLEVPFRGLLRELPEAPTEALEAGRPEPLVDWERAVQRAAWRAWAEALHGLEGPRALRAASLADCWFQGTLAALLGQNPQPTGNQEVIS
jgi:CRISPR system Cascade subunit CasA